MDTSSKTPETRWHRLQSGQAMMEYWPTIPVGIALMIFAGVFVGWLGNSFQRTADGLNRHGLPNEICSTTDAQQETLVANPGPHTIVLSSNVYDPVTDTTTVVYTVTSGADPNISHWVLGIPQSVYANLIDAPADQLPSWVDPDPMTGLTGLKFDRGYNSTFDSGTGGGGKGKGPKAIFHSGILYRPVSQTYNNVDGLDTQNVVLVFSGSYTFSSGETTIKAGTETFTDTISMPTAETAPADTQSTNPDDLYQGCDG